MRKPGVDPLAPAHYTNAPAPASTVSRARSFANRFSFSRSSVSEDSVSDDGSGVLRKASTTGEEVDASFAKRKQQSRRWSLGTGKRRSVDRDAGSNSSPPASRLSKVDGSTPEGERKQGKPRRERRNSFSEKPPDNAAALLVQEKNLSAGSYGDELEQESRLESIVKSFLDDLGVLSEPQIGTPRRGQAGARKARSGAWRARLSVVGRNRSSTTAIRDDMETLRESNGRRSKGSGSRWKDFCKASTAIVPVLKTDHLFLRIWDTFTLLLVCYLAVVLPLFVGWHESFTPIAPWTALHVCIDVVFIIDMAVGARRGYWKDGMAVKDPYMVGLRYAHDELPFDSVAALPYLSVAHALPRGAGNEGSSLALIFVSMLVELRVVKRMFRRKVPRKEVMMRNPVVLRLAQILSLLLVSCHWMGCVWWAVSAWEAAQADAQMSYWRPSEEVLAQHGMLQWGHSFLWGASIITGFILYDVTPLTAAEVVVTAVSLMLGLAMSVVIISSTTSLLQSIDTRNAFGRQRLENISNYLEFKNVRPEISSRIVDFYAYKLTTSAFSLQDVDFTELPTDLAMHLTLELHKSLLKKCYIFSALPPRMLVPLLRQLQPLVAVPGEVVVREGHVNEKLFFIHRGTVQVFTGLGDMSGNRANSTQKLVATLGDNDFFGEASLIPPDTPAGRSAAGADGKASATIVCYSYCEFLTLSKQQLDGPLLQHMDFKSAISQGVIQRAERQKQQNGEGVAGETLNTRATTLARRISYCKSASPSAKPTASSRWKMAAAQVLAESGKGNGSFARRASFLRRASREPEDGTAGLPQREVRDERVGSFDRMKRATGVGVNPPPVAPFDETAAAAAAAVAATAAAQ